MGEDQQQQQQQQQAQQNQQQQLTPEQMRARIVELESNLANKDLTINTLNGQIETVNKSLETFKNENANLKQQNYDLFLKVPQSTGVKQQATQQQVTQQAQQTSFRSVDDIISILKK